MCLGAFVVFCIPALAQEEQVPGLRPMPGLPPNVRVLKDQAYALTGGSRNVFDLYLPRADEDRPHWPLVIWIHGGGFVGGSKDVHPPFTPLLTHGFAVAAIHYRLAHQAPFPAQIEDCKAAVRWLRRNAAAYHLDPDRIGVWGASAGGTLAALLGTAGDKKEWEAAGGGPGNPPVPSRVQAVCDWFGATDFLMMAEVERNDPTGTTARLLGGPLPQTRALAVEASPFSHVSADAPPFLIMHGDKDPLVPLSQSEELRDALQRAGVPVTLDVLPGAGQGGDAFMTPARLDEILAFFARYLKR